MGRHTTGAHPVREAPLTVHHADPDAPELSDGCEAAEPEEYGVRVTWQSEAERIEAAEFLVATRTAHEKRLRAAHDLERLERLVHAERKPAR